MKREMIQPYIIKDIEKHKEYNERNREEERRLPAEVPGSEKPQRAPQDTPTQDDSGYGKEMPIDGPERDGVQIVDFN